MLKGPIEIRSEHYEPVILQTGDSTYFDSTMKHVMLSAAEGDDSSSMSAAMRRMDRCRS